jgi:hypothetical protein
VSKEIAALTLTLAVHVVGAGVVVWGLLGEDRVDWRSFLWPRDGEDGGGGHRPGGSGGDGSPAGPGGTSGLPLPDATQAPFRLREPARLGDLAPRPARRPAHVPVPERERDPALTAP